MNEIEIDVVYMCAYVEPKTECNNDNKTSNSFVEELGRSIVNQLSKDIIDVNQCNSSFSVGFWVAITKNGKMLLELERVMKN